jgi:hypothetical protein
MKMFFLRNARLNRSRDWGHISRLYLTSPSCHRHGPHSLTKCCTHCPRMQSRAALQQKFHEAMVIP